MLKLGWLVWTYADDEHPTFYKDGEEPEFYSKRRRIVYAEV